MLDGVSLDQLRTFIAAAEEGSFSAAGRRLSRAQSAVSQAIAGLEDQLGIALFSRAGRYPELTPAGRAILADARLVTREMDGLKARARAFHGGLEPELSIVVDALYPIAPIVAAVKDFYESCSATSLRLSVEALGAVVQPLLDGTSSFAIMGSNPAILPPAFPREPLAPGRMVSVSSPSHALAQYGDAVIPNTAFEEHTQLVVTDRTTLTSGQTFGVLSARTWRLTDQGSKHALLKAGLGWGNMPLWLVEPDLASGALVRLRPERAPDGEVLPFCVAWRPEAPPGPAGRWLIDRLKAPEIA